MKPGGLRVIRARLGKVPVGDGEPVKVMGVINVSPESFYKGSVKARVEEAVEAAVSMAEAGADIVDVGGVSTAPYVGARVSVEEELRRVIPVIRAIKDAAPDLTVSVDTFRARVAQEALRYGVEVVNDVTGLRGDEELARVVKDHGASLIIVAREPKPNPGLDPLARVVGALRDSLSIAERWGIDPNLIVVDPGIGFPPLSLDPVVTGSEPLRGIYRHGDGVHPWYSWDVQLILNVGTLRKLLGRPVAIGSSRKSFLAKLMRRRAAPEERLAASLATEAIAVLMGCDLVRTHNVAETRDVVRVAEGFRECLGIDPVQCSRRLMGLVGDLS